MSKTVDVVCDGVLFAVLEEGDLPGVRTGPTSGTSAKKDTAGDPDFPAGEKPKKRRRSKKDYEDLVIEIE